VTEAWHGLAAEAALARLASRPEGLSEREAEERLARYGPNDLPVAPPPSLWSILAAQLRSVVVALLAVATLVAWLAGERLDAAAILVVLVLNTALGFAMELKARRAMDALRRLEVPRALVRREGRVLEIDARRLVPGDVIELEAGRQVPADARLLSAAELRCVEATLTGESLPVHKRADAVLPEDTPLADRVNLVYRSTAVAAGAGRAVVFATGAATEVGRIGRLTSDVQAERTPLEKRLDALGRRLVVVSLAVAALVGLIGLLRGGSLALVAETAIALGIAAVPEGLPAVSTIALAIGVARMARRRVLVRRLPQVETLGSTTVVCTDKTGTLTAGVMTASVFVADGEEIAVSGAGYDPKGGFSAGGVPLAPAEHPVLLEALRIGALCNRAEVLEKDGRWEAVGDPTEAALLVAARKAGLDRRRLKEEWPEQAEIPFSSERAWMATFHAAGGGTVAFVKGAPGRIVERSTAAAERGGERPLDDAGRAALLERNRELAARGLRVLALARGAARPGEEPQRLTLVGLVGMEDPVAAGVLETIAAFARARIRTVMITGDQKLTAVAVAGRLGILPPGGEVLEGRELARLDPGSLTDRLRHVAAFCRVSPEDKLRIVSSLQAAGEVVAMLGDGVNDAPALRKADLGVAMGGRGTDVAKEAAAVVLQDDRFPTLAAAVEEGRVIFDNIRKFVFYLFSCNLAEVLVLLAAGLVGLPQPLFPLQILWLNLVTDTLPALSLAAEPAEAGVMDRPPRDPREAILSRAFLGSITSYGALIAAVTLAGFVAVLRSGSPDGAVTVAFVTLGLAQGFHLGNARSVAAVLRPQRVLANPWALAALGAVTLLQVGAVGFTPLARLLGLVPLSGGEWAMAFALSLLPAILGQAVRLFRRAA
jgi:P-type Ca2+ transporter type 2C